MHDTATRTSGLGITIAVHIGLGALLLAGWQVSQPKPALKPITLVHHTAPVTPPLASPTPRTTEQPVTIDVAVPIIDIADPQPVFTAPLQPPQPGPLAGTSDGTGTNTITPPPAPSRAARPLPGTAMQPPYPMAARALGEEGAVIISVTIDETGRVTGASVLRSSGHERLDAAALAQALKHWRFLPAEQAGQKVASTRRFTIRFSLADA
jgi:protein TonB